MKGTYKALIAATLLAVACTKPEQEEEHHDEVDSLRIVTLTPQQLTTSQIALAAAEVRSAATEIDATAQIEAAPDRTAHVSPRVSGRIISFGARVGDRVAAGQSLAVIEAPELSRAMADYVSAVTSAKLARQVADKEKALFERKISSEREWRGAETEALRAASEQRAAGSNLRSMGVSEADINSLESKDRYDATFNLVSPIAGQIVEQNGALGQVVESGFGVFTVMDLREVWTVVDIYEQDLARLSPGKAVQVSVHSYPDRVFRGTVDNIGATLERATRTVKVRVLLPNPGLLLKPGMFANVSLTSTTAGSEQALMVPAAAVQRDANNSIVFVALGNGKFQARTIVAGRTNSSWIEVASGISAGDSVVTTGAFLLKSQLRKSQLGASHPH